LVVPGLTHGYEMDEVHSLDIDEPDQLKLCQAYASELGRIRAKEQSFHLGPWKVCNLWFFGFIIV
jgi:hypothetical protein